MTRKLIRLKIKGRFLLTSAILTAIIFTLFLTVVQNGINKTSKKQALELSSIYAQKYALAAKSYFNYDMGLAKALANSLQFKGNFSEAHRDSIYTSYMKEMLKMSPNCISVWASLELNKYQQGYEKEHGRKLIATMRNENDISVNVYFRDMDSPNEESDYYKIKMDAIPVIAEPYVDQDVGDFLITSIIYPIFQDNKFAGISGLDIPLDSIQDIIQKMDLIEGTTAFVISNTGIIVGHSDVSAIGLNLDEYNEEYKTRFNILEKVKNQQEFSFNFNKNGTQYFSSVSSFIVNGTNTPWGVCISIPDTLILKVAKKRKRQFILAGTIGLIFILGVLIFFSKSIETPIAQSIESLQNIAGGNFSNKYKLDITAGGNVGRMGKSINQLIDNLQKTVSFAQEIEKGNLESEFERLSENDTLGNALINMKNGLISARKSEEERRIKEQQISWASDGMARLATLLQEDNSNFGKFAYKIITYLVQYTKSNQGGIFLINQSNKEDVFIELVASYAFNKKKLETQRIELEEGMIGACIKESKTFYIKEVPVNYISIESGLGEKNPSSLLIVPIKTNTQILGAIEIASFNELKDYEIKFLENTGDSLGAAFSSINLQNQTSILLKESKMQAEQMLAQEEEMRQNMEEMMATQEEMELKEEKLQKILAKLENQDGDVKKRVEEIKKLYF